MLEARGIKLGNDKEKQFCEELERDEQDYFCKVKIIRKINKRVKTVNKTLFAAFIAPY
jgi:hypothetical protein